MLFIAGVYLGHISLYADEFGLVGWPSLQDSEGRDVRAPSGRLILEWQDVDGMHHYHRDKPISGASVVCPD